MAQATPFIAILDVGHGNSAVIRGEKQTIIIDCGTKASGLYEFLLQENIKQIDKIYISHADLDHIGGLTGIVSTGEFQIGEIHLNSDSTKDSDAWNDLAYLVEGLQESGKTEIKTSITRDNNKIEDCGSFILEITGPTVYLGLKAAGGKDSQDRTITTNSLSASFRVGTKEKFVAYLAGDLDQIGYEDLLRAKADMTASVLVFPHHGGKAGSADTESFAESLCKSVTPDTVIFSTGRIKHENPRPEIVKVVRKTVKDVRIACTQLSKNCAKIVKVNEYKHLADVFSKGRENKLCCSGTFLILPDGSHPSTDAHIQFIKDHTESPLCQV